MRCTAYATAGSYNLPLLFDHYRKLGIPTYYRDVVYLSLDERELFFFSYGIVVLWGFSEEEELKLIQEIKPYSTEPLAQLEKGEYDFSYDVQGRVQRDEIILTSRDILTKLACSYCLSQSVKLEVFERTIDKTIAKTKHLPKALAEKGKIFLSRKEISKKIGELFIDRSSVNLHSEVLDEPEFFWEYPEHHPLYRDLAKCLDLKARSDVLNDRLVIVGELLKILSDQLNHQHSAALEWTIIWLIVIEVVLAVLRDLFHLI